MDRTNFVVTKCRGTFLAIRLHHDYESLHSDNTRSNDISVISIIDFYNIVFQFIHRILSELEKQVFNFYKILQYFIFQMVDEVTKKTLSNIPLLKIKASPRDGEQWRQRLKEELQALIHVKIYFEIC